MSEFDRLRQKTLEKQIRPNLTVTNYHQAFGLLFDVLTDLLGLAKYPEQNEADGSEQGKLLLASIAALAQHCAEDMALCPPQESPEHYDAVAQQLLGVLINLRHELTLNTRDFANPEQHGATLKATTVSSETYQLIEHLIDEYEHLLLPAPCAQSL